MQRDKDSPQVLRSIVVEDGPDPEAMHTGRNLDPGLASPDSEPELPSREERKTRRGFLSFGRATKTDRGSRAGNDGVSDHGLEFDSFTRATHARSTRDSRSKRTEADSNQKSSKSHKRNKSNKSGKSSKSNRKHHKGDEFELDGLEEQEAEDQEVFYKRLGFWLYAGPALWTILLCVISVILKVYAENRSAGNLPFWRFTLFFALLPPIYLITNYILFFLVLFFESQFFTTTNVLYFVVALKSPARWVIMALLLLPLYIPLFASQASLSAGASTTYHRILSFIACLIIFATMNLLKVLIAKLLSSYFHSSTHFSKMQEALDKEYYLKILATPRQVPGTWMQTVQSHTDASPKQARKPLAKANSIVERIRQPLKRSLSRVKKRAASLPNIVHMDHIDENRVADLEAEKQAAVDVHADSASVVTPPSSVTGHLEDTRHSQQISFEPPDPVPQTPIHSSEPASPHLGTQMARQSVPVSGVRPWMSSLPKISSQNSFRDPSSLSASRVPNDMGPPVKRSNSDGAALSKLESHAIPTQGQEDLDFKAHVPPPIFAPPRRSNLPKRPSSQNSKHTENKEGKSTVRTSNMSNSDVWGWKARNDRTPSVIKEEVEPESPARLPGATNEMTNEQGVALVSTIHQVEKHIRKNQIGLPFMRQISNTERNSESEAKKLAFFIFWNVKPSFQRNYVVIEDIMPFLSERKAQEAFAMLDRNGDGQVTITEMRLAIQDIFNERQDLSLQLRDTKSVVSTLELVIGIALHIVAIFFYLMIFGINIQQVWVLFTSIFVGFAFIFGNSIKNLFEAVLFLFVQHPFDVGDMLILEDGSRVKVEEIALSTITMRRADGVRLWVPMTLMVPKTCQNLSRSDNKADSAKFLVDIGISAEALQEVDKQVGEFIDANERDFTPSHAVQLSASADPLKTALLVTWEYSHNGVDGGRMGQSKSDLLQVVSDTLTELRISNTQAPLGTHL